MAKGNSVSAVGIILMVVGFSILIISGSQLFFQIQKNGILLNNVRLEAGQSISAGIGKTGLGTDQLSTLTIISQPPGVPVIAEIKSQKGEVVSEFKVNKNPFVTSFSGGSEQEYTLIITNAGDNDVSIQAAVVNIPAGSAQTATSEPNSLVRTMNVILQPNLVVLGIAAGLGIVLSIAGIIIVIIGVIKTAREKSVKGKELGDSSHYPYSKNP
jgi:hypothetical protein